MSETKIPNIKYIEVLKADNTGMSAPVLEYSELDEVVQSYEADEAKRLEAFWEAEPNTVEELAKARQLGFMYMVATADKVVSSAPESRDIWADRFTNASIELFGGPDKNEAVQLIARQKSMYEDLTENPDVSQDALQLITETYSNVAEGATVEFDIEFESDREHVTSKLKEVLETRYAKVLSLVDDSDKEVFDQPDLIKLFSDAISTMEEMDGEAWKNWKAVTTKKGTNISTNGGAEEIQIPKRRSPVPATEAKKLLAHELLTHGLRAKNGKLTGNKRMAKGFPSYGDSEEGLAILMGSAGSDGEISDLVINHYIDIALAIGTTGATPKKRTEMYDLVYARNLVKAQASNETVDEDALRARTSSYVDRLYSGPGDDIGTRQAVNTMDVYYYVGLKKMTGYIKDQLGDGKNIEDIFDFIMKGKFDPTNKTDAQVVESLTS
jgi:hypothetical protein